MKNDNRHEIDSKIYDQLTKEEQATVDVILDNLKAGAGLWKKGWVSEGAPVNAITGKEYSGVNDVILTVMAMQYGYKDPRWLTFNQMTEKGWSFKKDDAGNSLALGLGVGIIYYEERDRATGKRFDSKVLSGMSQEEKQEYTEKNIYRVKKRYTVFNGDLIEGIPEKEKREINTNETNARADAFLENWSAHEAKIVYGGDRAFYRPSFDEIHLPEREKFYSESEFYSTALHELGHSTGHETRLNRNLNGGFGSAEYAKEELRAEIGSMFLEQHFGVTSDAEHMRNNSAYIQSWYSSIRNDPKELFDAIGDAGKIKKYVDTKEKEFVSVAEASLISEAQTVFSPVNIAAKTGEAGNEEKPESAKTSEGEGGIQGGNSPLASGKINRPSILCEWSESEFFKGGAVYSIAEFDKRMKEANEAHYKGKQAAIAHYGSEEAWYNSDEYDEYTKFMGYDKVKYTLYMQDGRVLPQRQDVGDDLVGAVDFLAEMEKHYPEYKGVTAELLRDIEFEKSTENREPSVKEFLAERAMAFDGKPTNEFSEEILKNIEGTNKTVYGAVGEAAERYTVGELAEYLSRQAGAEIAVRYYLENQLAAIVINHDKQGAKNKQMIETASSKKIYMLPSEYAAMMENSEWVDMTEPDRGTKSLSRPEDRNLVEKLMHGYDGETFQTLYEGAPVYGEQVVDERTLARWLSIYAKDEDQMREIFRSSGQYRKGKTTQHYEFVFADAIHYAEGVCAEESAMIQPVKTSQRKNHSSKA